MRHAKYTDYGIRILIYLYNRRDQRVTTREVSRYFNVSYNHLAKVIHHLGRQKLIEIYRGRGGGYKLAEKATKCTLGEIVRLLETDFTLVECFNVKENKCRITPYCRVKGHLQNALNMYFKELDKVTLDQFAEKF